MRSKSCKEKKRREGVRRWGRVSNYDISPFFNNLNIVNTRVIWALTLFLYVLFRLIVVGHRPIVSCATRPRFPAEQRFSELMQGMMHKYNVVWGWGGRVFEMCLGFWSFGVWGFGGLGFWGFGGLLIWVWRSVKWPNGNICLEYAKDHHRQTNMRILCK